MPIYIHLEMGLKLLKKQLYIGENKKLFKVADYKHILRLYTRVQWHNP